MDSASAVAGVLIQIGGQMYSLGRRTSRNPACAIATPTAIVEMQAPVMDWPAVMRPAKCQDFEASRLAKVAAFMSPSTSAMGLEIMLLGM
jgi:hypothetical protein